MADASPLKQALERDGALLRLTLARPKANIVDAAMIGALSDALAAHAATRGLRGVLLGAEGPNFSFGASVEEHLADRCAAMLASLHALILSMLGFPAPILVAVRGQCLGGGLEVALAGGPIFASRDAQFGQPEMKLGVFAPAASCLLPELVGPTRALDLLVSGRTIAGNEAVAMGLALATAADPEGAALAYFAEHLAPKSASSLRFAVTAARFDHAQRVRAKIEAVERMYLNELMKTHDAVEGLTAFIEKRAAQWQHH